MRNGQTAVFSNYCLPQQDFTWEAKQLPTQPTERPEVKNIISYAVQYLIRRSAGWLFAVFIFKSSKNNNKIREENQNLKHPERKKSWKHGIFTLLSVDYLIFGMDIIWKLTAMYRNVFYSHIYIYIFFFRWTVHLDNVKISFYQQMHSSLNIYKYCAGKWPLPRTVVSSLS